MRGSPGAGASRPPSLVRPSAARTISLGQRKVGGPSPHKALKGARRSQCPRAHGSFVWSLSTDRAAEIACGSWDCSWCQWRKRAAARIVLQVGLERAFGAGERVRLMTLTDNGDGAMTVADFYAAWNRLRVRLRRSRKGGPYVTEYAAVLEVQQRGALHLHVIQTGRYIRQRELAEMAVAAGFGRCTDIREVKRIMGAKPRGRLATSRSSSRAI